MRIVSDRQKTLSFTSVRASARQRWEVISDVLDANPEIAALVWDDLTTGKDGKRKKKTGARGMSADQVLRFAIVQRYEGLSFRRLYDRVDDSIVLREFCRVPFGKIPAMSTLQENIKKLRQETLVEINAAVVRHAEREGVEDGKRVRIDTTGVESNIHYPRDSRLLWDSVRVLTRILRRAETELPWLTGKFSDHTRSAKKLLFKITNSRGAKRRKPLYRKLIAATAKVEGYGRRALELLVPEMCSGVDEMFIAADCASALEHFLPLVRTVIEQAERRVIKGEDVAAADKVLSIFEPHADIIKKGQREILYGHKVLVTGGKSNLILDCQILEGNPADSDEFIPALDRHCGLFGKTPRQVATDAGFASKQNGEKARAMGVRDIAFSTSKGNKLSELVTSARIHKALRKWRAGIEGIISATKRAYGLTRCNWRSFESFKSYVQLAVLTFNLHTLARHMLA